MYTEHCGKEVMYHVASLLPFPQTDPQQLQQKRHHDNDIVFQKADSHFLHTFIVVQHKPYTANVESDTLYRVSVTARSDVPYIGPVLPLPPRVQAGAQFRAWTLNKLITAETACYKVEKFSQRKQKMRASQLSNLVEELTRKQTTNERRVSAKWSRLKAPFSRASRSKSSCQNAAPLAAAGK